MRYLSVCSGIEAATLAWEPLGWQPAAFSEIDPFPCHVLHHRFGAGCPMFMPDPADAESERDLKARANAIRAVAKIPELGRVPNFGDMTQFERWPDAAIDVLVGGTPCQDYSVAGLRLGMDGSRGQLTLTYVEIAARYRPRWLVWENVPGVLSSNGGRDFARFLGEISGSRVDVPECGWKNAGIIPGIPDAYGLAYRVLDAQFVRTRGLPRAVPQRRRRVFVVGYLGDWRRAAAVLFDRESLSGNPPPRRQSGQRPAPTLASRPTGGGGLGTDFDLDGGLISMAHGQGGAEIGFDHGPTLTCNHEAPIVAHSLRAEGFDASEDGTGRGTPIVPVKVSPTLRAGGNRTGGDRPPGTDVDTCDSLIPIAFDCLAGGETALSVGEVPGALHGIARSAVAFAQNQRDEVRTMDVAGALAAEPGMKQQTYLALPWAVRRLTPVECERLQGATDRHTMIPWRGRDAAPDGPRYKALGNSMARNAMEWIGERIVMVDAMEGLA